MYLSLYLTSTETTEVAGSGPGSGSTRGGIHSRRDGINSHQMKVFKPPLPSGPNAIVARGNQERKREKNDAVRWKKEKRGNRTWGAKTSSNYSSPPCKSVHLLFSSIPFSCRRNWVSCGELWWEFICPAIAHFRYVVKFNWWIRVRDDLTLCTPSVCRYATKFRIYLGWPWLKVGKSAMEIVERSPLLYIYIFLLWMIQYHNSVGGWVVRSVFAIQWARVRFPADTSRMGAEFTFCFFLCSAMNRLEDGVT